MRTEFLLTIRLTPETKEEQIAAFGAQYREFREQTEQAIASKLPLAIPHDTEIRWLICSGRFE